MKKSHFALLFQLVGRFLSDLLVSLFIVNIINFVYANGLLGAGIYILVTFSTFSVAVARSGLLVVLRDKEYYDCGSSGAYNKYFHLFFLYD